LGFVRSFWFVAPPAELMTWASVNRLVSRRGNSSYRVYAHGGKVLRLLHANHASELTSAFASFRICLRLCCDDL
jgi:hypothetical protein